MFTRGERKSILSKERAETRYKPKAGRVWIKEELALMRAREVALVCSLEEACQQVCVIADEIDYEIVRDTVTGVVKLKRLLNKLAVWKRNIENPYTIRRGARMYQEERPEVDSDRRLAEEVSWQCFASLQLPICGLTVGAQLAELQGVHQVTLEENKRLRAALGLREESDKKASFAGSSSTGTVQPFSASLATTPLAKQRPRSAPSTSAARPFRFSADNRVTPLPAAARDEESPREQSKIAQLSAKLALARSYPLLALSGKIPVTKTADPTPNFSRSKSSRCLPSGPPDMEEGTEDDRQRAQRARESFLAYFSKKMSSKNLRL